MRELHDGGSLCSCEALAPDVAGRLAASAQGTFKYWRGPLGGIE